MDGLIDLHIHTVGSDGSKTALEIEEIVEKKKLAAYAITDHDTIIGMKNFIPKNNGILFIPGIEISVVDKKRLSAQARFHLLGLDIDLNHLETLRIQKQLHQNSVDSLTRKIEYVALHHKNDFEKIPKEEIDHLLHSPKNIGAPDFANLMIQYKVVDNISEAFEKYLKEAGEKTRFDKKSITPEEAICVVHKMGGLAILAHPNSLNLSSDFAKLREYLLYLKNLQIDGIETAHIHLNAYMRKILKIFCNQYDLLESAGSDYHGIGKIDVEIGTGRNNNLHITHLSVLDEIKGRQKVKNRI